MKKKKLELSEEQIDRVIEMAWEDRTPFDAIVLQFGLKEQDVIQLEALATKFIVSPTLNVKSGSLPDTLPFLSDPLRV